jgi:hypothetical protein
MERNGRGKKTRKIDEWIWTEVTYMKMKNLGVTREEIRELQILL